MAGSGAYAYLRRSLPQTSGTVRVEGLSGPVEIVRDADAIPHIFAANKNDAVDDPARVDALEQRVRELGLPFHRISAVAGHGLDALLEAAWREIVNSSPSMIAPTRPRHTSMMAWRQRWSGGMHCSACDVRSCRCRADTAR